MPAHAPLQDPILSFLHTFSLKSTHIGGQTLPKMGPRPPTENPGSDPAHGVFLFGNICYNNWHQEQEIVTFIYFVKIRSHFLQNTSDLNQHQQVLKSSVLCSTNCTTGKLGVKNCSIDPFTTEFNKMRKFVVTLCALKFLCINQSK